MGTKTIPCSVRHRIDVCFTAKRLYDDLLHNATYAISTEALRVTVALLLTISEEFAAVLCLIESHHASHCGGIVRSMIEAQADLILILRSPAHLDQMKFENARNNIALFDRYAADPSVADNPGATSLMAQWQAAYAATHAALKVRNFKTMQAEVKFQKAGLLPAYIAYKVFCGFSHNQLSTLIARHQGPTYRYHDAVPDDTISGLLGSAIIVLKTTMDLLPQLSDCTAEMVQEVGDKVENLWASLPKTENAGISPVAEGV